MNPHGRYKPSKDSSPDCADLITMAERELSAFFNAVTQLFGPEEAELSAEDWLHELIEIDGLPASAREWRMITAKVSARPPNGTLFQTDRGIRPFAQLARNRTMTIPSNVSVQGGRE